MSGRLEGKTALITAAAQGIGRATAIAFAAEGANVWATDINESMLQDLDGEPATSVRHLDVTDRREVETIVGETGPVDILVNCAGFVDMGSILDCSDADWDRSFDINVRGMFLVTRAMLPAMLKAGGGAIVNIASVASSIKGVKERCAYSASKAAVIGFTKSVAADYMDRGFAATRCVQVQSRRRRSESAFAPRAATRPRHAQSMWTGSRWGASARQTRLPRPASIWLRTMPFS